MNSKSEVRSEMKAKRAALNLEQSCFFGKQLLYFLKHLPRGLNWLSYQPIQNEISTQPHFEWAKERGDRVFFPRTSGASSERQMNFFELETWEQCTPGPWSLEPPETNTLWTPKFSMTIALVPGLAFDFQGKRLGFGGGFYDRFFEFHPSIPRFGLAYDFQVFPKASWHIEEFDISMDAILTPQAFWASNMSAFLSLK